MIGTCRLCGSSAELAFTARDRNRELSAERFGYGRCVACGTLSLIDVPDDLGRYYAGVERFYGQPSATELERLVPAESDKLAFVTRRVAPTGRLVEIGPGSGAFALAARHAGFDVEAIEMDAGTCEHVRARVGVAVVQSDDPAAAIAELPPSRAVVMWHVIEHLHDPSAVIDAIAANLEPGGVLALSTPNPGSVQARLLGRRWAHVDAPRHLALLPLEAVTAHAERAGLRRVEATTADATGRDCNLLGWELALRRRPADGPSRRPLLLATYALGLALRPIEQTGLRGAAYTAAFVKDGR